MIFLQVVWSGITDNWNSVPSWLKFLIFAHAVNTWPTPGNKWGQWALGIAKFGVGQRISGQNAINGMQSEVTAVTLEQKKALQNGSKMEVIKTPDIVHVTPVEVITKEK